MATRIYIAAEATDLCPREHELGTYGLPRLCAFWDGRACGTSEAQPSFPRPRWRPFSVSLPALGGELTLKLVEADPLQPRPQAPFCYGSVSVSSSELQPVTYRSVVISKPLERAPGKYGQLSLELSLQPLADNVRAAPSAPLHLAHPTDWCGVLRFAVDFGELQGRWSMEAACSADGKVSPVSPSSGFISWTAEGEATDVKELFIVERDVVFSAHASCAHLTAKCVKRLSRMRGPGGSQCNMFVEAHPEPVPLEIVGVKQPPRPPRMHLRFFPADFLRPRAGMPCGISLRFTLAAAPPGLELPLVIYVPSSCFSSVPGMPGAQEEASFCISHIGDCAEVCLMDPSKLLGRSLWRLSANFSSPDCAESQSFLDVLSLKLHLGDERVLTMPLGDHAIVLRLLPSTLRLDVPRPVFGLFLPPAEAGEELRLHGAEQGEVAGIFVHSLAVHSPHVRCCFISAGPDPGTLFYPLPHMGGKVFIPAQPNENGKIVAYAFLPDFGYHAMAETAVGDACCQLHWVFNEGAKTAVLAAALITIARWPVSEGLSSASISIRVMQTSVPEQASSLLAPLHITFGQSVFTWSGKDGEHEAILSAAAGNGMEVQCGEAVTSSFSLPELLLAQSALGFTYEEEPQEAESEESYSEEEQAAPKKLVFDEKQGMLVPTSASDSEDSREAKARRARHRRAEIRKRPRRVEALAPGNLSLPVIVEERQGNQSAMAFCFLPVRVQHVSERPMLQGALDAAMHRIQSPDRETAGVILLQQFSAFARLDAHKDPSCQGCWEPVHALSLTATGFPGVAARASCRTAVHSFRGCAASWGVVTSLKQSPPHILKMRFATPPGQTHLDVQIEFRFTCSSCGEACTFTAFGQVQMTALWQPIDVHLAIRKDQGVIAAGHLGAAFARLLLCPSQICTQPGLLTLELQPLYPGGPGVSELLDMETNLVRSGFYGPAMHEVPAGLRMAVDKAGGPALILDGRPEDFTAAGRAQRQLCLELGPEDALTDLRLELQALTGSRRFLRSMLLAALGPLGDTAVMAFHIHFGPRCSLALLCSFEAQRHALQLRQAKQPEMPIPAQPAESVSLEDPWRSSQQRRVSQALQRLRPEPGGTPRRERAQRAKGGAVTTGWRRSTKSHPFLERGPHHWLTDKCPYPVQRTEARRVLQTWTQEMGRQRPASAPRSKGYGSPVAVPVRRNLPPDWDEKAEAKDGPKYRAEFIGRQKQKIFQLREDLQRCRVSKERMDQQMSHLRRLLRQAQQELDPKASHPRGGATKIKTIRSLRSKSQSGVKGEGSSTEQRDESKQVCLRCEKAIPPEGRFCCGCFPGVLEEALQLREKVGKQLVQAASLRHKLDGQKREEAKLEARKCDLEARLFASEAGVQDSNTEPAQMLLATMAQLRSLRRDDEARSRLAAEQLEVLSQRDAASAAALEEANARLKKANDEYDALEAQLRKGDKKVQTLLGEIEKLSSPMRNAGGATTVLHQGLSGGLRLPIDHPVAIRASEMSR